MLRIVPAYLQGFETPCNFTPTCKKGEFQHTYKGSKPEDKNTVSKISHYVPAYLQGFETSPMDHVPFFTIHVPAYLQGFETLVRGAVGTSSEEFQHTYKGSKLRVWLPTPLHGVCSSIPTRVRN